MFDGKFHKCVFNNVRVFKNVWEFCKVFDAVESSHKNPFARKRQIKSVAHIWFVRFHCLRAASLAVYYFEIAAYQCMDWSEKPQHTNQPSQTSRDLGVTRNSCHEHVCEMGSANMNDKVRRELRAKSC